MKYINIIITCICFLFALGLDSADIGGFAALWDPISLIIVMVPSYLLTATAYNSYNFFNNKKSVQLFGNLAIGFGLIGTIVGLIYTLTTMTIPPPSGVDPGSILISNLAISIITLLYGFLIKYFIALPLAHSIKDK